MELEEKEMGVDSCHQRISHKGGRACFQTQRPSESCLVGGCRRVACLCVWVHIHPAHRLNKGMKRLEYKICFVCLFTVVSPALIGGGGRGEDLKIYGFLSLTQVNWMRIFRGCPGTSYFLKALQRVLMGRQDWELLKSMDGHSVFSWCYHLVES